MKYNNGYNKTNGTPGETVFVVTRDKRRTSERNFTNENDARNEADYWIRICRQHDPRSKVSIVKTDKPKRIR